MYAPLNITKNTSAHKTTFDFTTGNMKGNTLVKGILVSMKRWQELINAVTGKF